MRHYVIYDAITGEIILAIKGNGIRQESSNCIEVTEEDYNDSRPIESVKKVEIGTKKLVDKNAGGEPA